MRTVQHVQLLMCLSILGASYELTFNESAVGVILLVSNSLQYNSTGSVQVVNDALQEVNGRTDLLADITLEMTSIVESIVSFMMNEIYVSYRT